MQCLALYLDKIGWHLIMRRPSYFPPVSRRTMATER